MTTTHDTITEEKTSKFVQTRKWKIHYNEVGTGAPLVLLHGGGPGASGWSNFVRNIPYFADRYRVLAVDMPGWGKSDTAVPGDRDHVEALELVLDELGLDTVNIVGNSIGGATAIRFTANHPDRVATLVPMGAPAPGPNIFGPPTAHTSGIRALARAYFDPTPENFQQVVAALTADPELAADESMAASRSEAALSRPDHLENWRQAVMHGGETNGPPHLYEEVVPALARIDVPTLIVHGRDDAAVHYENALRLLSMIPSARLHIFNRCGHWTQMEHPDEFNSLVHNFIAES
ncbi:alpha/beta fold hydrolase [Gordonia terrae]|uniref:alpha/beta fold hydrolase n=1 Tax=Gordonia terrae TaxID=2055 RepID=UPI003F6A685D